MKLEIKNTAVSKPSLKIAKKTTKKTPHEDSSIAPSVFPSSSFLSLTCFDSQKITYQIRIAVKYKKIASKSAAVESLPREFLAINTKYPTRALATIAAATPAHNL